MPANEMPMSDSAITAVLSTALPDAACADEQHEFQRGLQLIAQLIIQQSHNPAAPMQVQPIPESES